MTPKNKRISYFARLRWLAAAVAITGVVASAIAALAVRRDKLALIQTDFEHRAWERSLAIERELRAAAEHVGFLATLYETYGDVDRQHFSTFVTAMLRDQPTIQAIGFDEVVTRAQRQAHERAMREDGLPGYTITERDAEGRLVPAADRERYVVVGFIEPLKGNEEALGYDISSEPTRAAAVERATMTGAAAISARLRLVQEPADQFGALICVPVYHGSLPVSAEARRAKLRGIAVGVIRYGDIVDAALRNLRPAGIDMAVFDDSAPGERQLLTEYSAGGGGDSESAEQAGLRPFVQALEIGDRRFVVRGTPTAMWVGRIDNAPILVFLAGVVGSALLGGYVVWQSSIKRRLLHVIKQLEHSEQRRAGFGRMLDESHDEIYVFDAATLRFVNVNRGACRNLGYSADELSGMTPLDLKPRLDGSSFAALIQPLRDGVLNKVVFTTVHRRKDGSEYDVEVHLQLSTFDGAPAFIAMVLDVTERLRIEEQLRQSQRIEALGTMAGGIAHDFNNLLTAIMGYTELSRSHAPDGSPLATNLDEVTRASERARDIVRRILAFSRKPAIKRQSIDLVDLASETLQLIRASLPASVEIRQRLEPTCVIEGDGAQIHQVLMNLCTNAAHAMAGRSGVLEFALDTIELDLADAERYTGLAPGRYARIVVQDTGHGMTPEVAEHVFEPFFTTKPQGEGSGMGLAVTHGIIASHGGTIRAESVPGHGTTFEVLLPSADGVELPVEATAPSSIATHGGTETILLVDDEPAVVEVVHQALTLAGYTVESYSDPGEAVNRFCERPDHFDLVITDYTMPKLSGADVARRVRGIAPDLPLILVSGFGEMLDESTLRECGISAVMAKPQRMSELRALVRALLDGTEAAGHQGFRSN